MIWNVYKRDLSNDKIEVFNIFNHPRFYKDVVDLKKKKLPFEEFERKLHSHLFYYFWAKYEMETVITTWPPYLDGKELERVNGEDNKFFNEHGKHYHRHSVNLVSGMKISIYDQIELNWDKFVDYVYNVAIPKKR